MVIPRPTSSSCEGFMSDPFVHDLPGPVYTCTINFLVGADFSEFIIIGYGCGTRDNGEWVAIVFSSCSPAFSGVALGRGRNR